jgi:hypothetical protein
MDQFGIQNVSGCGIIFRSAFRSCMLLRPRVIQKPASEIASAASLVEK